MKWPEVSARDRRALRLGALAMLGVAIVVLVAGPYARALRESYAELEAQRGLLARELGALRFADRDAELARRGRRTLAEAHSRLFEGADLVTASARLASYVADRAADSGVDLEESETRPVTDSVSAAAVDVAVSGHVLAVVRFLRGLEGGPRLARVEQIAIARPLAMAAPRADRAVTLRATIVGLSRRSHGGDTPPDASPTTGPGRR